MSRVAMTLTFALFSRYAILEFGKQLKYDSNSENGPFIWAVQLAEPRKNGRSYEEGSSDW